MDTKRGEHPIDQLGGISAVRKLTGEPYNVVWNWRHREIPWRYRPFIAEQLELAGKPVPAGFLTPPKPNRAA